MLKKLLIGLGVLIAVPLSVFMFCQLRTRQAQARQHAPPVMNIADAVARGDRVLGERIYQVRAGCVECHGADLAGRVAIDDPAIGTFHGANLTVLRDWSDEEIARAIRFGVHRTGRALEFMPSFDYVPLSREDLGSLIAYIRAVPRVEKQKPENRIGALAGLLFTFGKMPILFSAETIAFDTAFPPKPVESSTVDFGAYLAQSCTGCHGSEFRGGPIPGGDPSWPSAASLRLGDGAWDEQKFTRALREGVSPTTGAAIRPPMPIALTAQLNETEISALWKFLSTLN